MSIDKINKGHALGKSGEEIACEFLLKNKYQIIEKNFRSKLGEIDIIAKDKNEIVFVEVKTRGQKIFGTPAEAVTKKKKNHIYNVAEYYMWKKNIENVFCRIDVIEIYMNKSISINHIKNAVLEKPIGAKYIQKKENEEETSV